VEDDSFTLDSIWNEEKIKILQPKHGYRFALDAVLLAHFLKMKPQEEALEIGSGSGVITILLSRLLKFKRVVAVELQHSLAELAKKNFKLNSLTNVQVLEANVKDVRMFLYPNSFDLIFSNPPYRKVGAGKLNPSHQKAMARHELKMTLEDLILCAVQFLKTEGRISMILPAFREADLTLLVQHYKLHWRERRYVHSFAGEPPAFILATFSKLEGKFVEHPGLIIYDTPGTYSVEVQRMLTENNSYG
jgi:tRNA1(Val) A37 N6-methylase TrmN6